MADTQDIKNLETAVSTEAGTNHTIANVRAAYADYVTEQLTPVKYADYCAVVEHFYRTRSIPADDA
jgi:hypothetical protein